MSANPDSSDDQSYEGAGNGAENAPDDGAGTSPDKTDEPGAAALQALADENWDRYLRAAAELDNVRKRAARDMENARKYALERFATELLAVRDSLEMGLHAADGADAADLSEGRATTDLIAGSRATLKQLSSTMGRFGVEEVDPLGEPFDPTLHEAMTMQPSSEVEPNTVLTVFQKGYTLNGRLLRPARVVVASAPQPSNE